MDTGYGNLILILHFAWALWMISGVVAAMCGYYWNRLWRWRVFRIAHLLGLFLTASVPVWAGGVCPLTGWESTLGTSSTDLQSTGGVSFLVYWIHRLLYVDISPEVLSGITVAGAVITAVIFLRHPPRRSMDATARKKLR